MEKHVWLGLIEQGSNNRPRKGEELKVTLQFGALIFGRATGERTPMILTSPRSASAGGTDVVKVPHGLRLTLPSACISLQGLLELPSMCALTSSPNPRSLLGLPME